MLRPLQRALALRLIEREPGFFIATDAALVLHGGHRETELLELHSTGFDEEALPRLSAEVEAFAGERSCEVRQSGTPVSRRFVLSSREDTFVTTLRLQQLVLDSQRATVEGLPVATRREVQAWLLTRLGREQSTGDLVDLAKLLEGASHRDAIADAWAFDDDAQPALLAWTLGKLEIDEGSLPLDVDAAALERLRAELLVEAERQAVESLRPRP